VVGTALFKSYSGLTQKQMNLGICALMQATEKGEKEVASSLQKIQTTY